MFAVALPEMCSRCALEKRFMYSTLSACRSQASDKAASRATRETFFMVEALSLVYGPSFLLMHGNVSSARLWVQLGEQYAEILGIRVVWLTDLGLCGDLQCGSLAAV